MTAEDFFEHLRPTLENHTEHERRWRDFAAIRIRVGDTTLRGVLWSNGSVTCGWIDANRYGHRSRLFLAVIDTKEKHISWVEEASDEFLLEIVMSL